MAWRTGSNSMKAADFITAQTYSELSQQFDLIELCIIAAMRDTSMHLQQSTINELVYRISDELESIASTMMTPAPKRSKQISS